MAGANACMVDIPKDWKIWPVISVRHLLKARDTPDSYKRSPSKSTSAVPGEDLKPVEIVLNDRVHNGRKQYFVKFAGLPLSRNEWLDESEFENSRELISEFEESFKRVRVQKRKRDEAGSSEGSKAKRIN
ncbi:hypothetical protein EDC01DRAFT_629449 [Geopyxis carbonaria]|nr:hypothetical protein EDC01DRAFT_629449 [Geopyxis carbonaria]